MYSSSSIKPSSPESSASVAPADENQEPEQPGTPVPSEETEVSDNGKVSSHTHHSLYITWCVFQLKTSVCVCAGEKPNALAEPRGEEESLTKKGKKKKTVHWAEEEQLKHYFYFDLDETERGETWFWFCSEPPAV